MNEVIRYAFLSDWVKEATQEEIIEKLIEHDERAKEIKHLQQKVEQLEKENKELRQPQVFIDCEDMEERYGRDLYEDYLKGKIEQLENIILTFEKWLKEHSNIDYNCKETIIHEQLALNTAYEYLKELKDNQND